MPSMKLVSTSYSIQLGRGVCKRRDATEVISTKLTRSTPQGCGPRRKVLRRNGCDNCLLTESASFVLRGRHPLRRRSLTFIRYLEQHIGLWIWLRRSYGDADFVEIDGEGGSSKKADCEPVHNKLQWMSDEISKRSAVPCTQADEDVEPIDSDTHYFDVMIVYQFFM